MKTQKGFTLIELLVVIAIIGILSSVVLASLNTARGKGADAAIKSNLSNIRAQAELYYDNNSNTYGVASNLCTAGMFSGDPVIAAAVASAVNASGSAATCRSTAAAWAISVPLKTVPANSWCVDSLGSSESRVGAITTTNC